MNYTEKQLEKKLIASIKDLGGLALKLPALHMTGLPDRLCLLPEGRLFFAELKSPGKKPRKIQRLMHDFIKSLGFEVYVIDNDVELNKIIESYGNSSLKFM